MRARRAGHAALLLFLLALMLLLVCPGALGQERGMTRAEPTTQPLSRKHKHHHLLLFMGGLKSLAALVLIKIKIVLVVAAIVAVAVFTIKYLLGASDLAALLHKAPLPPQPPPPPPYLHEVVHEPVYGHGPPHHHHHLAGPEYATPIPWEHTNHEHEGYITDWSKYGEGGRSLLEISNLSPSLGKILIQNSFNHKRNKIK